MLPVICQVTCLSSSPVCIDAEQIGAGESDDYDEYYEPRRTPGSISRAHTIARQTSTVAARSSLTGVAFKVGGGLGGCGCFHTVVDVRTDLVPGTPGPSGILRRVTRKDHLPRFHHPAATRSVFAKSLPLNSSGSPMAFARAYEKQSP